jgi:hypothetical protein
MSRESRLPPRATGPEMSTHLVKGICARGKEFGGVGLSGLEPLTSALSGEVM